MDEPHSDSAPPKRTLPGTVVAVGWVSLLTDVATEMAYPLLPKFVEESLGAGKIGLGWMEGLAESAAALLRLPAGALSDRLRLRKPLMVIGYGVAGLARPLMGLATAPWQAVAIRLTDRFGKGIRGAPRDALITDVTRPEMRGRAFGFHRAMDHAGAALGPLLAFAFLSVWPGAYRALFLLTIVPGLVVLGVLIWGVREARGDSEAPLPGLASEPATSAGRIQESEGGITALGGRFFGLMGAMAVFTLGNCSDLFLLSRTEELGLDERFLPLLWAGFHVLKSAASWYCGGWGDRVGPARLVMAGWAVHAVVYLGFGLAETAWQGVALWAPYALFYGLSEPNEKLLVARASPAKRRGTAFGCYHFAVGIAALPASVLFGWIWSGYGPLAAFGLSAILSIGAQGILLAAVARGRPDSPGG